MHSFHVLVHGRLSWTTELADAAVREISRPKGFYCHRYVLASTGQEAAEKAFKRIRRNLDRQTRWITDGVATLALDAEEVTIARFYRLLKPDNRGHTFYDNY